MLFFVVVLNLVRDQRALESQVRALILCGGLAGALGLLLFLLTPWRQVELLSMLEPIGYPSGWGLLRYLPGPNDTYTETIRAIGTSVDPNVFAGMLLVAAALITAQLFAPCPIVSRAWLVPLGLLVVACMLATHSRATWLGLAAAGAWIATLRYRRAWLLGGVAAVLVAFTPLGQTLFARVLSGFAAQDKASALRVSEYANAVEIIRAYPVLGIGFGVSPQLGLHPGVSSQLLLVAQQVGLLGLAAYVITLAAVLVPSLRSVVGSAEPRLQGLVTALQAGFVAALVAGLFDHYWANTAFQHAVTLFWYLAALLVRGTMLDRASDRALLDVQHLDRS
jgi:O-antigen ligase